MEWFVVPGRRVRAGLSISRAVSIPGQPWRGMIRDVRLWIGEGACAEVFLYC